MKPNTPGFVGANLRRARQSRGMTAVVLAEKLVLTKAAISNYETGKQSPNPDITERLSEILNYPVTFFLKKPKSEKREYSSRFYRSMASATKRAREKADAKLELFLELIDILEALIELPAVNFPNFNVPSDPTKISDEYIENLAVELRRFWGLGEGPISNTIWLLENNGAVVIRRPLEAETLDAFSLWVDDRPYIILGSEKNSASRSRFDIAHEVGHIILHRKVPDAIVRNNDYFGLIEKQANRFAGAFQFPQSSFVKEVVNCNLESFRLLKRRWKLSIAMMIQRCENLELVNEKKIDYLWRSYSRNGWRTWEPLDDELEVENPYLLGEAIQLVLSERILSRSDILSELRTYHPDAEDCAGLSNNCLNPRLDGVPVLSFRSSPARRDDGCSEPSVVEVDFRSREKLRN
jgi:Zn-dependent peptidase ImmA (M78 family)/transcriptional regulator with XRE-family HTH domain